MNRRELLVRIGISTITIPFFIKKIFAQDIINQKLNWGEFEKDIGNLGFYFGLSRGIFAKEGLNIDVVTFGGGPAIMAGVASGDIDMGVIGPPGIIAISRGIKIKFVSSGWTSKPYFFVVSDKSINSVTELRGKTVGINQIGSGYDIALREILRAYGLSSINDVEIVSLGTGASPLAALQAKRIDAAVLKEHLVSYAEYIGVGHLLACEWDYLPNCHQTSIFASQRFIDRRPDIVQKTLERYWRAQEFFINNFDEAINYGVKSLGVKTEVLSKALHRFKPFLRRTGEIRKYEFDNTVNVLLRNQILSKRVEYSEATDMRFLD